MKSRQWLRACGLHRSDKGFTLIEVMITVAVVAILSAIAIPSYTAYVQRSKLSDARTVMLAAAQLLERRYTISNTYCVEAACTTANVIPASLRVAPETGTATYDLTAAALPASTAAGAPPGQRYVISAVPRTPNSGVVTQCGILTLNSEGQKGSSGTADVCWRR
jgi:type IV pilus assembly protein PilE